MDRRICTDLEAVSIDAEALFLGDFNSYATAAPGFAAFFDGEPCVKMKVFLANSQLGLEATITTQRSSTNATSTTLSSLSPYTPPSP